MNHFDLMEASLEQFSIYTKININMFYLSKPSDETLNQKYIMIPSNL